MEHAMDQKRSRRMEELEVDDVVKVLQEWEMEEFVDFVTEKRMDGRKLLEITEGIVKLWRPKANAKQFIHFIHNLKQNPDKYIKLKDIEPKDKAIEAQYQTVNVKRMREQNVTTANGVEEILKKLVPAKSFLYRNQVPKTEKPLSSYVPMEGSTRKTRRFFRLSYDYPNFDLKQFKFSRNENFNDRGYYSIKSESSSQKIKKPESRTKYKSLSAAEEIIEKFPEDHFYEDLCYNDMDENKNTDLKIANPNVKPCMAKIQELFHSFKLPFFRRSEEIEGDKTLNVNTAAASEKETHIYENSDSIADMYDSVHVNRPVINVSEIHQALPVEEYLEPVQVNRDYCDVETRARDESILGYIMNIFETRFGIRRETNDSNQTEECDDYKDVSTPDERDTAKWPDDRKLRKTNMADRPLPVPVENEPYYMNIDRDEAENLLRGHPDGTFVLRPSSQPNHAYTLTVSCSNAVHNVGVRRRPDGRLALGFARRGERSFASVTSLLRHHRRRRLLLVAGGSVCGATTLNESPQYYQTPSGLPVLVDDQSTTLDAEAGISHNIDLGTEHNENGKDFENGTEHVENGTEENRNGYTKLLKRMETVPDIKRDTSGMTTQYIATGIVNLGALAAGICVAWSSSAVPNLIHSEPQHITESEASWVASLLCLGAFFGSVPAGLISEYFGRKKTLLYLALPLLVSWILVSSSPNVYGLYVGRFVGGVAVGAFSVSIPPYVEDIAEKQLLPALANFYHVLFTGGVLFGYIIAKVPSTSWLCMLSSSIPVAFFIAFMFLPESPAYLISQGKQGEAKAALRYYRGIDNDIDSEIKQLKEYIRNSAKNRVTFKELFSTRATIKALVVSFGLMIFQQMSGIYPILFYAEKIFQEFHISLEPPAPAIILGFCLVSSTYFATMLLKKARRRVLLIISFSAMALSLGGLAIFYHLKASTAVPSKNTWIPLFALCMYVTLYATGVGPIPWLMLREIFPPNVTRRATAITAGFHWFLAFGVTKLYQNLLSTVKHGWTLWYFAVTCVIGVIFVYFFVPETKGRSLEEIQNEFDGIHKKKRHMHVIQVESVEC